MPADYLAAAGVLTLLVLLPGPDVAVVTRVAMGRGGAQARWAAVGVVCGLLVWGTVTVAGLASVLAASSEAYDAIRIVGAAYLIVLGVRALWRSGERRTTTGMHAGVRGRTSLRIGLFTNLLNPKIAIFYTTVLPTLVPRGASTDLWLPLLVATHALLTLVWLTTCATALSRSGPVLGAPRVQSLIERVTGVALIGFGIRVALEAR